MIIAESTDSPLIVKPFAARKIKYAFHDIDGTHSLIRDWPPVMSRVLWNVMENGLADDFDSEYNLKRIIAMTGTRPLPETDAFCIESAGLSALTQMEWAIRRAIENGTVRIECDQTANSAIAAAIGAGREVFPEFHEGDTIKKYLAEYTPRLFRFYEKVLNGYCRDKNLAAAKIDPDKFIISGSKEFVDFLHENGVKNYLVTGAVVEKGMGMHEEVVSLGYSIGEGCQFEDIIGSSWTEKQPKDVIMERLASDMGIPSDEILVLGDGRSEISAGVKMGALTMSRLNESAAYQREMHKRLGTNIIIADYNEKDLKKIFRKA